jgi:hypothetical protein
MKQLQTGCHVSLAPSPPNFDDDNEPNYVDSELLVFSHCYQPDIDELDNERKLPQGSMPKSDLQPSPLVNDDFSNGLSHISIHISDGFILGRWSEPGICS